MKSWIKRKLKKTFISDLYQFQRLHRFRKKWNIKNAHNQTVPKIIFDIDLVNVGKNTYGDLNIISYNNQNKINIGSYCSIAPNVVFVINAEHRIDTFSTYPFRVKSAKTVEAESFSKGDIDVGDDVWIGYGATIMSGVKIGQGAVIAAGAVVTNDIPPYSIVGGVPAKVIKYRFEKEVIDKLLEFDFELLNDDFVIENIEDLYKTISTVEDADKLIKKIKNNI